MAYADPNGLPRKHLESYGNVLYALKGDYSD